MKIDFDYKNPENKQKIMVVILVIVIFVTALILYLYFFSGKETVIAPIPAGDISSVGVNIAEQLNTEILENERFQDLDRFGNYPVEAKENEIGRSNPFKPY